MCVTHSSLFSSGLPRDAVEGERRTCGSLLASAGHVGLARWPRGPSAFGGRLSFAVHHLHTLIYSASLAGLPGCAVVLHSAAFVWSASWLVSGQWPGQPATQQRESEHEGVQLL